MRMAVRVVMIMTVMVTAQHEHAGAIHDQAEYCNCNCLVEGNLDRTKQTVDTFPRHQQCKECQQDSTCIAGEGIDLARAETEARVCGAATGVDIGDGGDAEGGRMRAHMQTICK